jgi:hypothetical protein
VAGYLEPVLSTSECDVEFYDVAKQTGTHTLMPTVAYAPDLVIPVKIAIDPGERTGWVNGASVSQLQEFWY